MICTNNGINSVRVNIELRKAFTVRLHMVHNEAEKLKIQQIVAKARGKTRYLNNLKLIRTSELKILKTMIIKSLLDLLKIFTEPAAVPAIINEVNLPQSTRGM